MPVSACQANSRLPNSQKARPARLSSATLRHTKCQATPFTAFAGGAITSAYDFWLAGFFDSAPRERPPHELEYGSLE